MISTSPKIASTLCCILIKNTCSKIKLYFKRKSIKSLYNFLYFFFQLYSPLAFSASSTLHKNYTAIICSTKHRDKTILFFVLITLIRFYKSRQSFEDCIFSKVCFGSKRLYCIYVGSHVKPSTNHYGIIGIKFSCNRRFV